MTGYSWIQIAFQIVATLLIPPAVFAIKRLFSRIDEASEKLDSISDDMIKVKTVLMGPNEENGLRSDVKALQGAVGDLTSRLDRAQIPT